MKDIRTSAEELLKSNMALREQLYRAESQRDWLAGLALAGWVCFVAALVLPL